MVKVLAAWCLCILAAPRAADAEWHFTPFTGLTFAGNTSIVDLEIATGDTHPVFGGAVSMLSSGVLGGEGIFALTPGFFEGKPGRLDSTGSPIRDDIVESSRVTTLMGNIVLTAPRRYTEYFLRPFVSGGFGLLRVSKTELINNQVFPLEANFAGFNIGGGAVGFFSQRTGVRFDFRYYSTLHDTDHGPGVSTGDVHLRYFNLTVGFVIRR